jgi:ABC-type glycerol-3-phosphate transport system substrate-binding protein
MAHIVRNVVVVCVLLGLATAAVSAGAVTKITIGHIWDTNSHTHKGLEAAVAAFAKKYPHIEVEIRYGVTEEKFVVEALGGTPADIQSIDGPMVSAYALRGFIIPLTDYLRKSGVSEQDFVPPSWRQNVWDGHVWAMPYIVDPNFALIWNKDLFANAGLNTEVGPVTLPEYEAYFKKLTRYEGDSMTVIGTVP